MIIHLDKSKIFTIHPAVRFGQEYSVSKDLWTELWKRYMLMGYDVSELCEYFLIKSKQEIGEKAMRRWVLRTHIYSLAQDALKKGATTVKSEFFRDYENDVVMELTKSMRFGGTTNTKNIV